MTDIKGTTRVCGLIGNPVEHSLSPLIHNELAVELGLDMVYVTFKVESEVEVAVKGAFELNILGMNVTVPWKQEVMNSLSDIDLLAQKIGAVNTLVRTDAGYKGYNTDILGIKRELLEAGVTIKDKAMVILGAGGAARAIAFLLAAEEAGKIYILNRSIARAEQIAEDVKDKLNYNNIFSLELTDYKSILEDNYVVIQTTSVGLYPKINDTPIEDMAFYKRAECGVDIIYNPANTRFMQLMQENGKPAYNGLKMLLYQAIAAFELWNDVVVSKDVTEKVYEKLERELAK